MRQLLVLVEKLTESNCYCIEEDDRVLIIDPNDEKQIEVQIRKHGWIPEMVILTHEHCDHMRGLNWIRDHFQVQVIATEACSRNLQNSRKNMSSLMGMYLHFRNGGNIVNDYPVILCQAADITFEETYEFYWRGHAFYLTAIPGHTEGSCSIRMDQEMIFSGDYMIPGEVDLIRFPGGNEKDYEMIAKPWMKKLMKEKRVHIYPGHGKDYWLEDGKEV